ncbi:cell wall hydrolase [Sphingomonas montana]|uniref:cell wall hydrolase n=1 Tax=Sphingomonas montana TaxID=1843236 RepID=UPI00096DB8F2|nr:cell wall hydrolase [Sphingomonas montana]
MSAAVLVPASMTSAAETPATWALPAAPALLSPAAPTQAQLNILRFRQIAANTFAEPIRTLAADDASADADTDSTDVAADQASLDDETLCMAKVVHHEAGNQSRAGQLAVAQTILNRKASGRFAGTVCGVVHQRNQYFDTTRYHPNRASAQWQAAVAVAFEALSGKAQAVVPGALFFRAAYSTPTNFFKGRIRVAALGDHVFYR